jgi:hypothetical protein
MPQALMDLLLQAWRQLLTQWAQSGALCRAARDALLLDGEPSLLGELVELWAVGDFRDLPPIELLPAASMTGAAGAYAISTGTIYLNADWLRVANGEQVLAVLTEELGHHLDGLLNASDTPGDEGALRSALVARTRLDDGKPRLARDGAPPSNRRRGGPGYQRLAAGPPPSCQVAA